MGLFKVSSNAIQSKIEYLNLLISRDKLLDITSMFNHLLKVDAKIRIIEYDGGWFEFDKKDDLLNFKKFLEDNG